MPWALALENLRDGDGNPITPEAHATCPGRAVTPTGTPTKEQQTAEDEAAEEARKTEERRRVRRRNTDWRAATETRTAHLKAVLGRKAPPPGALQLIAEAMARGETQPQMSSFGHQTACELLGLPGNGAGAGYRDLLLAELARASEKRVQVIAQAMVLGAAEHGVRDVHAWQSAEGSYWASYGVPLAARYLAWLAAHTGYALSDIEAEVAAHATGPAAASPSEPAGKAEPGADRPDGDGDPATDPGESEPERDGDGQEQALAATESS